MFDSSARGKVLESTSALYNTTQASNPIRWESINRLGASHLRSDLVLKR